MELPDVSRPGFTSVCANAEPSAVRPRAATVALHSEPMPDVRPSGCAQCAVLSRSEVVGIMRRPQSLLAPLFPALFVLAISMSNIGNDPAPPVSPGAPSRPGFPYVS